jgi:hypothetical protein
MSKKLKITSDDLRMMNACDEGLCWFAERFPDGATLDELEAALREHGRPTWTAWLAWQMPIGFVGDSIERRLSWCALDFDRSRLGFYMPLGLTGDSLDRRCSWCALDFESAYLRRRYAGLIPESV